MPSIQLAKIVATESVGPKYLLLTLLPREAFKHAAGQHLIVTFEDHEGEFERPYSIASAARADGTLDLCLLTIGDNRAAAALTGLLKNHDVKISAPRGKFTLAERTTPKVFIAGGSGISPLRAMLHDLTAHWTKPCPRPTTLVYGCDDFAHVPYYKELQNFASKLSNNFTLWVYAKSNPAPPCQQGIVTDKLLELTAINARYYLCGPPAMQQAVRKVLATKGIPDHYVFSET